MSDETLRSTDQMPHTGKSTPVFDLRRPTPTEFSGYVVGGTIGAYTAGPLGAIVGAIVGFVASSVFERYLDSTAKPQTKPRT